MNGSFTPHMGWRLAANPTDVAAVRCGCLGRAGCARHGRKTGFGKD
jgi:hypothetical protein